MLSSTRTLARLAFRSTRAYGATPVPARPTGVHHVTALRNNAIRRRNNGTIQQRRQRTNSTLTVNAASATALPHVVTTTTSATTIPFRGLASWLFGCSGMVFGMVIVGGSTRLTRSGLSMTDWKVTGRLPPMDEIGWMVEFDKYRNFPEYKRLNMSMTVDEFKSIYWWEWGHRMWGRGKPLFLIFFFFVVLSLTDLLTHEFIFLFLKMIVYFFSVDQIIIFIFFFPSHWCCICTSWFIFCSKRTNTT